MNIKQITLGVLLCFCVTGCNTDEDIKRLKEIGWIPKKGFKGMTFKEKRFFCSKVVAGKSKKEVNDTFLGYLGSAQIVDLSLYELKRAKKLITTPRINGCYLFGVAMTNKTKFVKTKSVYDITEEEFYGYKNDFLRRMNKLLDRKIKYKEKKKNRSVASD